VHATEQLILGLELLNQALTLHFLKIVNLWKYRFKSLCPVNKSLGVFSFIVHKGELGIENALLELHEFVDLTHLLLEDAELFVLVGGEIVVQDLTAFPLSDVLEVVAWLNTIAIQKLRVLNHKL
jgi:hypothetical protein